MKIKILIKQPRLSENVSKARLHRITRLMALAIKLQDDLENKRIKDQAELARLGRVTRARISQIMDLTLLSPRIIEEILFFPRVIRGREILTETAIRKIAKAKLWTEQENLWAELKNQLVGRLATDSVPQDVMEIAS